MKKEPKSTNRDEVYEQAKIGMEQKYNMVMLKPMEYNNTYALAMQKNSRSRDNILQFHDLGKIAQNAKVGSLKLHSREDGYKGMRKLYNLWFSNVENDGTKSTLQCNSIRGYECN